MTADLLLQLSKILGGYFEYVTLNCTFYSTTHVRQL